MLKLVLYITRYLRWRGRLGNYLLSATASFARRAVDARSGQTPAKRESLARRGSRRLVAPALRYASDSPSATRCDRGETMRNLFARSRNEIGSRAPAAPLPSAGGRRSGQPVGRRFKGYYFFSAPWVASKSCISLACSSSTARIDSSIHRVAGSSSPKKRISSR